MRPASEPFGQGAPITQALEQICLTMDVKEMTANQKGVERLTLLVLP